MPHALPALRSPRALLALLITVLAVGAAAPAVVPQPAAAQLLNNDVQTKDEARAIRDAKEAADDGGSLPLGAWLGIAAFLAIGGAAFFILRDSQTALGDDVSERRKAPARKPVDAASTRGVPKAMFEGEGSSSNPHGRTKKRQQGKRQKAARRANRPKR